MARLTVFILLFFLCFQQAESQIIAPVDHNEPGGRSFELIYEYGKPFNPSLPTIIVVADAQQFYVRKGGIKKIQDDLFGDGFNVLGIVPRGSASELWKLVVKNDTNEVDWEMAYRIYNSFQFVNDIELVRKSLLAQQENVYLYGQSGGAFLITEYLSLFPDAPVRKVFIGASVNPVIENRLGINHDDFYREFLSSSPDCQRKLEVVLNENYFDRPLLASLFQRQNFFIGLDEINNARLELTDRLHNKDTAYINGLKNEYQIDAISDFLSSEAGVPIRVRIYEFIAPLLKDGQIKDSNFHPDLENSYNIALPIIKLSRDSKIKFKPQFSDLNARKFQGEVFVLSGRYDHVADYRSSIYLSAIFKNGYLFIANDDHTFKSFKHENDYGKLIQEFFHNDDLNWIGRYNSYRWIEN